MSSGNTKSTPAPLETGKGDQRDDNIDDMGRRDDGTVEDQPVKSPNDKADQPKR